MGDTLPVLEHGGNCVAAWIDLPLEDAIACPGCHRRYLATPERRFAAEFERILAGHMQRLANEGAAILTGERTYAGAAPPRAGGRRRGGRRI